MKRGESTVRRPAIPLSIVVMVVLAGCAGGGEPAPDRAPSSPSPSPSPSPVLAATPPAPTSSPSPEPLRFDVRELPETLIGASVPLDAFRDRGVTEPSEDLPGLWSVTSACDVPPEADRDMAAAHQRLWSGDRIFVQSFLHGFESLSGADVVAEVRFLAGSCATYTLDNEDVTRVIHGEHAMAPPEGLDDFFAYCEGVQEGAEVHLCYGFLARANLVSVVVTARDGPLAGVQQDLEYVVPIAAEALLGA